jgi:putative PIG3 family NAD(P)H quinone oxidoreductase
MRFLEGEARDDRYLVTVAGGPRPVPGQGEVLLRVAASGVNRADLSQMAGRYPAPPGEPETLGLEVSGTLKATGEPVCALLAGGGHAEFVAAPEGQVFPLPAGVDLLSGAAIPEAYLTAYLNLVLEAGLSAGGRVLVHAGASGVGLAAIQVAKFLGAHVAAATRSAGKLPAIREAGADLALDSGVSPIEDRIAAAWGRDSIDVILDPVGASTLSADLAVLAAGGRVIFLATMGGARAELDIALLMKKRARLIGSTLRSRPRSEKAALVARFRQEIVPGFASGALRPRVDSAYPPERASEAFERMRGNLNTGKIVIDWRS